MPTITLNVNNPTMGYCIGAGNYDYGTSVQIQAIPYQDSSGRDYNFIGWSDGDSNRSRNIIVTGNATYTANFISGALYLVSVNYDSSGGSVKIRESGGTDHPYVQEESYPEGTQITVTAEPNLGYEFGGWWDEITGLQITGGTALSYSFTLTSNVSLQAFFYQPTARYELHIYVNDDTMGTVRVSGSTITSYQGSDGETVYEVAENTQLTLTSLANSGYKFVQWEDGLSTITTPSYTFTVTGNKVIEAVFETSPIIPVETTLVAVTATSDGVAGIINSTLSGTVVGTILNKPTPDPFTYQFYWSTDIFDVTTGTSSSTVISWTPTISGSTFTLPVGDSFENMLVNATSGTFYMGVMATSTEEIKYQNNIPFALVVSEDYHPVVTLANSGNLTLGNAYEQTVGGSLVLRAIAGYTTYGITYSVSESPNNNSATITNVTAQPNIGSLATSTGQLLGGTFASSGSNYNFVINVSAIDTRKRVTTNSTNSLTVFGYHLPYFNLVSIEHCDENGVVQQDETLNKYIHVVFTLDVSLTDLDNVVQPGDIVLVLNNVTYSNKVTYSNSQYSAIIGGSLDPTANYSVAIQLEDTIMDQLSISAETFTVSLSTKFPLSLLDDKAGKVGAALGIEATQDDVIEMALDTSFKNNVLLKGNTIVSGTNYSAQISSYDLIHNAVRAYEGDRLNSNNQDGNYALTIRTMTGNEYKALATKDQHTLYFLSSPVPTGV